MRKLMILVFLAAAAGGVFGLSRYLAAESAARSVREHAQNFPSLLAAAAQNGPISVGVVEQIVHDIANQVEGVTIPPGSVDVTMVPIAVGPGHMSCDMPPFPPEMKKLSTLDQGNIRNLAIRCTRDLVIVGFHAKGKGPTGRRFAVEGWSYARGH